MTARESTNKDYKLVKKLNPFPSDDTPQCQVCIDYNLGRNKANYLIEYKNNGELVAICDKHVEGLNLVYIITGEENTKGGL